MTVNIEKLRADIRTENRRFLIQALSTGVACVVAGAAVLALPSCGPTTYHRLPWASMSLPQADAECTAVVQANPADRSSRPA